MLSLMDFLLQIEQSRMSLTRTGQGRLEQLVDSKRETNKQAETEGRKPLAQPVTIPVLCCAEATV